MKKPRAAEAAGLKFVSRGVMVDGRVGASFHISITVAFFGLFVASLFCWAYGVDVLCRLTLGV